MRKPKITPSLLISILALVVAMGGASYAAATINGKNIQAKTIGQNKLKKESVGSNRIKDGKLKAKDLAPGVVKNARWVQIGANGQIISQSGGFSVTAAYPAGTPAAGNVYINAGEDLSDNGLSATIQLQNTVNQAGGLMNGRDDATTGADIPNAEFSGEISASRCNFPGFAGPTNCAPAGTQTNTHFVVSPRLSDGGFTTDGNRKSFFAVVN